MNRALRAATIGVLLLGPVTLSACSAGQVNQTASQNRDKVGPEAVVGPLQLRAVTLAYPRGGTYSSGDDAVLNMAIVNNGEQSDTLVSISGPDFAGIRVSGTGAQASAPTGTASAATSTSAAPTTSAGASSGAATSSSAATTTGAGGAAATTSAVPTASLPSEAPSSTANIPVPGNTAVFLGQNAPHVALVGLTRSVTAAQSIPVTFTFQRAGAVTVNVIVAAPNTEISQGSAYNFEVNTKASEPGNRAGAGNVPGATG